MTTQGDSSADTRQRVLEAAGEVFAEKGFDGATIREIVERAGANLNAVNYYFRDKHGLYVALFEHAFTAIGGRDQALVALAEPLPAAQRLRAIVGHILGGFILTKRAAWQARLIAREMSEPTETFGTLVERFLRPRFEFLIATVRELASPDVPDLQVRLGAESVLGQCVHIAMGRAAVSRFVPELSYTPAGVELMADHITAFSLAAIRHWPTQEHTS